MHSSQTWQGSCAMTQAWLANEGGANECRLQRLRQTRYIAKTQQVGMHVSVYTDMPKRPQQRILWKSMVVVSGHARQTHVPYSICNKWV